MDSDGRPGRTDETVPAAPPRTRLPPAGLIAALTIFVGVLVAAIGAYYASNPNESPRQSPLSVAPLSRNDTCAFEVLATAGVIYAHGDAGIAAINTAIGLQSEIAVLGLHVQATINMEVQKSGLAEARPAIEEAARTMCSQRGNPLLTASQVDSLIAVADPGDAAALSGITLFA